ncbi:MAG: hypothetical protein RLZZ308_730 [Candidatus Parcubacteria bacterium]
MLNLQGKPFHQPIPLFWGARRLIMESNRIQQWVENYKMTRNMMLCCVTVGLLCLFANGYWETVHFLRDLFQTGLRLTLAFFVFVSIGTFLFRKNIKREAPSGESMTTVLIVVGGALCVILFQPSSAWNTFLLIGKNTTPAVGMFFFFCAGLLSTLMWKIQTTQRVKKE